MRLIKIIESKEILIGNLTPHPDALALHAQEDDRAVLDASIDCVGILEPLMVVPGGDGNYLVIDGVGRMQSADEIKDRSLPCLVVECEDVRTFVGHKNAIGRKRSTGSRILSYVMSNSDKVLSALYPGKTLAESFGVLADNPASQKMYWGSRSVAERLKVSKQDVLLAVELLRCLKEIVGLDGQELDHAAYARLTKVFNDVLSASTPIRRWKAAFAGTLTGTQEGESGQAMANYGAVLQKSLTSLGNAWKKWPEISMDEATKAQVHGAFRSMVQNAPEAMRHTAALGIVHWPESELKALQKKIAKKLSDMA